MGMTFFKYLFSAKARAKAEAAIEKLAQDEERAQFLREQHRIYSENVITRKVSYNLVYLRDDYNPSDYENALAELRAFYARDFGEDALADFGDEDIKLASIDGHVVLRYRKAVVSESGNGWNPLIYPNVTPVKEIIEGRVDVRGKALAGKK